MSRNGGKCKNRTLALAALTAAWRFLWWRRKASRGTAWFPLILHWLRKPKRFENVQTGRVTKVEKGPWLPQFHLHYHATRSDSAQRGLLRGFHTETTMYELRRMVSQPQWVTTHAVKQPAHSRQRYRMSYGFQIEKVLLRQRNIVRPVSTRLLWGPNAGSTAAQFSFLAQSPLIERVAHATKHSVPLGTNRAPLAPSNRATIAGSMAVKLANGKRGTLIEGIKPKALHSGHPNEPRWTFETRRRRPQPVREVFRPQTLTTGTSALLPLDGAAVRKPQFGGTPELLWRQSGQSPISIADKEGRPEVPQFPHRTETEYSKQKLAPKEPILPGRKGILELTKFDPGLLDRLTDDVIRRVEQRVRINRERRGI